LEPSGELPCDGDGREFYRTPELMSVAHSYENNSSNSDSGNRIVQYNFSVRRRFQTETGIRLAFHKTVKEAQFRGIKVCYNKCK
jgi:hypothetical protein